MPTSRNGKPPNPCDADCLDGWLIIPGKGAKPCECQIRAKRQKALDRIPPEYRGITLANVQPRADLHKKQPDLFNRLREKPDGSYFLCGKNGSGKSLAGWLLYRAAVEAGRPVVGLPTAEVINQLRNWELDRDKLPIIDAETLRNDKRRWLIFLDEFEKARVTDFTSEQLFLLLDAAYSFRHQLVITSNLCKDQLEQVWSKQDAVWGASIMRRVIQAHGMCEVKLF